MTDRRHNRRYRKRSGRQVWVFSELNRDLRPEQIARIITAAGLEQARREAEARTQHDAGLHVGDDTIDLDTGDDLPEAGHD